MATEVGASLQGSMSNWAGDLVPALPAKNWYEDVESFEQNGYSNNELGKWWLYSTVLSPTPAQAIWVNCDGKRFTDENLPGNTSPCAVARQQRASAIIICDSAVWEDWMSTEAYGAASPTCKEMMDVITSDTVGGKVFQADTIEDLADQLNNAGPATYKVHKTNLVQTVKEYNEAAKADKGDELFPPKAGGSAICVPLENPPFYAVPARPTIYATYGGVAIDENTQVLDISRKPIEGLYACVPTAGGAFHEAYTGCIADAGITGRMAGDAVAKAIA